MRQYMVLATQLFAAGHLSGRRIAVPLLRGTLRCVYTHVTLGDCLALSTAMPSGKIRCAKCSPTIPTLPGRSATTVLSFCADLRKWRNGASTRKRQCPVGSVSKRKVAECSQSTHQECRWECSHAGDTNRCSKEDLSVRLVWRLSRGVNLLSWYESRVPISVGNGHRPTPDSARHAQLTMLDRFASDSELPTSMWKPRRVQCLPGFVITIEITLLEIASKSRCDS